MSGRADCGSFHCGPVAAATSEDQRKQFQEEKQRQLEAMNFRAAGFGLNVKAPQNEAGNLAPPKTVPQNVNRRERRHGGQRDQRERISKERNHAGASNWIDSSSPNEFSKSSAIKVVIVRPALTAGVRPGLLQLGEIFSVLFGNAGINVDFAFVASLAVHDAEIAMLRTDSHPRGPAAG